MARFDIPKQILAEKSAPTKNWAFVSSSLPCPGLPTGLLSSCRRSPVRYTVAVSEFTQILERVEHGDPKAADQLLPLVYDELRRLAAQKMANEAASQTLQPTALVHEAWLRLSGTNNAPWNGRAHFFGAAAEAMRRILIENARRKQRVKHGGEWKRIHLTTLDVAITTNDDQLLALDEALEKLGARDALGAQLIKLRFFVGLPNAEAARLLGIPERTAKRAWAYARAWLFEELKKNR